MQIIEIFIAVLLTSLCGMLITVLVSFIKEGTNNKEKEYVYLNVDIKSIFAKREKLLKKKPVYSFIKRVIDLILSTLVLIILGPLLCMLSLLIKLEDGGPIIWYRPCIGYKGKTIRIRAFRTMRVSSDDTSYTSTLTDPRITRIGAFLRKAELDYLPMFVDVFLGRLSLVGLFRAYPGSISESYTRLYDYAKPGILGMSMTDKGRAVSFEEREMMDTEYLYSLGFKTDVKVLFHALINTMLGTSRQIMPQGDNKPKARKESLSKTNKTKDKNLLE